MAKETFDMGKHMTGLAERAWEELMVEKMKQAYEDIPGTTMEKAAKVTVKHMMDTWKSWKEGKKMPREMLEGFHRNLEKAFMGT